MVITEPHAPSTRLLGLSSKLYPNNLQYMLNKDLTRFISAEYFPSSANSNKRKKGSTSRVAEPVKLPKLAEHFEISPSPSLKQFFTLFLCYLCN